MLVLPKNGAYLGSYGGGQLDGVGHKKTVNSSPRESISLSPAPSYRTTTASGIDLFSSAPSLQMKLTKE